MGVPIQCKKVQASAQLGVYDTLIIQSGVHQSGTMSPLSTAE